jgi:DNA repair protein RecN (Recombination protein N)
MLRSLLIKNYALIKHLEIQPEAGLNIITGETGAGKSIMLGAMGLLMGNRADTKALFDENEKCVVEGNFDISKLDLEAFFADLELDYEPACLIRREISPNGKSRAFVNDTPVTLDVLKTLGVYLMDIHSQHDTLLLNTNAYQLALVDAFAGNQTLAEKYLVSYKAFKSAEKALQALQSDADSLKKEFDYNKFLLDELVVAKLVGEEQAELEEELMILENAEEVKRKLGFAFEYLNNSDLSVLSLLKDANVALGSISGISEKYAALKERLNSSLI